MPAVNAGDIAEYTGRVRDLIGMRCVVQRWTPSRKRVCVVFRVGDFDLYESFVKPDNLKRVGGGGC